MEINESQINAMVNSLLRVGYILDLPSGCSVASIDAMKQLEFVIGTLNFILQMGVKNGTVNYFPITYCYLHGCNAL